MKEKLSGLALPAVFVIAWAFALSGSAAPGAVPGESTEVSYLRWLVYFCGFAFISSSIMHSVFAKPLAKSIGWVTNGFQYEIAFVSLGIGIGCFYAVNQDLQALTAISIPIITFLFLAAVNHIKEMFKEKNFAPNNTLILIWDLGISISLTALLLITS